MDGRVRGCGSRRRAWVRERVGRGGGRHDDEQHQVRRGGREAEEAAAEDTQPPQGDAHGPEGEAAPHIARHEFDKH